MFDYIYTQQYRGPNPGWRNDPENTDIYQKNNTIYAHTTTCVCDICMSSYYCICSYYYI